MVKLIGVVKELITSYFLEAQHLHLAFSSFWRPIVMDLIESNLGRAIDLIF